MYTRPLHLYMLLAVALLLAAALATGGCDTSLEPFAATDLNYSIFGYLDARADTQFVRVEPLQDSILIGTEPFKARVTTTNLSTGKTAVWQRRINDLNPDSASATRVQVYWTTANVAPTATYRFVVKGNAGRSSTEVTIPPDFPVPTFKGQPNFGTPGQPPPTIVSVEGVEHLGAVTASYTFRRCAFPPNGPPVCSEGSAQFSHLDDVERRSANSYRITIDWAADLAQAVHSPSVLVAFYTFHVSVASVSADWPDYELPTDSLAQAPQPPVPGLTSNIEDGTGFLGGAVIHTINIPIIGQPESRL